jgi:hypothetical protein
VALHLGRLHHLLPESIAVWCRGAASLDPDSPRISRRSRVVRDAVRARALGGLIIEAWRGPQAIVAHYLLLLLAVAFVGGVLGKIPFGPAVANPISTGGRASLWLVPVMAVGLAAALRRVRSSIPLSGFPMAVDTMAPAGCGRHSGIRT